MKAYFWISCFLLVVFELALVYFIMPMPGSQEHDTLQVAYFLYEYRWWFRIGLGIFLLSGLFLGNFRKRWLPFLVLIPVSAFVYLVNFKMSADRMFRQVNNLIFKPASGNLVDSGRLVIGVEIGNEAKAYPLRMLGYHHFVADSVNGQPVLVTYCTVCRTGRVYDPRIDGKVETFRLVGMDHFNAMIEDATTKSWWQQATGIAVAGPKTGQRMNEIASTQTTLAEWLKLHPESFIMQPDPDFESIYDQNMDYEDGSSRKMLTGTNPESWEKKSWVVGIELNGRARAYDWNLLKKQRLIQDTLAGELVMLVMALDGKSFFAFRADENPSSFRLSGDTLYNGDLRYLVNGSSLTNDPDLKHIQAYQEFWYSWRTFHPETETYGKN